MNFTILMSFTINELTDLMKEYDFINNSVKPFSEKYNMNEYGVPMLRKIASRIDIPNSRLIGRENLLPLITERFNELLL